MLKIEEKSGRTWINESGQEVGKEGGRKPTIVRKRDAKTEFWMEGEEQGRFVRGCFHEVIPGERCATVYFTVLL